MSIFKNTLTDHKVQQFMGSLLRTGVSIAAAVVLAGGAIYLARHGSARPDYRLFRGERKDLRGVTGIVSDALSLSGRGVIQLGLLLLVATPLARVVFSVIAFARRRDRTFVAITLIVLGVIMYSLFGGGL